MAEYNGNVLRRVDELRRAYLYRGRVKDIDTFKSVRTLDGIRRMEARLVVTKSGRVLHGALGAYGVGVVHCRNGQATFGDRNTAELV